METQKTEMMKCYQILKGTSRKLYEGILNILLWKLYAVLTCFILCYNLSWGQNVIEKKQLDPLGIFLANHNQSTGIENWNLKRWKTEIHDMKKMGANTIWYIPIQFGQRSIKDVDPGAKFWELEKGICQAIVDEGMKVGIFVGYNDVFPETLVKHPEWKALHGKYGMEEAQACPSVPAAQEEISNLREKIFKELPKVDYIISPISDYGGCSCNKCAPLPRTYMKSLKEMTDLCRKYHPKVKVVAAGHGVNMQEEDMLRDLLKNADWVDYVAEIPRGVKPILKYYLSPEITMVNGWGSYGPAPHLDIIKKAYSDDIQYISGNAVYSEGIHDDINRFAVLQFSQDPNRAVIDVAQQYAEQWLNLKGQDASLAAEVMAGLGSQIVRNREYLYYKDVTNIPKADDRLKVLIDLRIRNKDLTENYRYWLLTYRAVYESFSTTEGFFSLEELCKELGDARNEIIRLEPEYGAHLNALSNWDKPDISPWNWPRSFNILWKRENGFIK